MSIVLVGSTSGSVTLQEPAVAGTTVLDLPAVSGTFITTTGGVAPSTSGNVLTSNGTTWTSAALPAGGVTSLNGQTGAITNTTYGAIGSYVVGSTTASGTTAYAANDTVAGSSLIVMNSGTNDSPFGSTQSSGNYSSASLTGTWRNAGGYVPSGNTLGSTGYRVPTLWVRVS
jgi:hypothetical protein